MAVKLALSRDEMVAILGRGECVILHDGMVVRSVDQLPPVEVPPVEVVADGLETKTKAELIAVAILEGSEPQSGTNAEIIAGIRAKRLAGAGA